MAVFASTPRKLFTPTPVGLHPAVIVDVYYRFDVPDEYQGVATMKDQAWIVWQFDRSLCTTTWKGKEVSYWQTCRYNVTPIRRVAVEGQEEPDVVDNKQYKVDTMRDSGCIVPPFFDENEDLDMFLGTRHALYKAFLGWGAGDFARAVEEGTFSLEGLIRDQAQFQLLIGHSQKDKHGQVWPRLQSLAAPVEGQAVVPVDYERMKDRPPDDEEEKGDSGLPF